MALLEVQNLSVSFDTDEATVAVLDDVAFQLAKGETLGVVGESGCGKSVTSLAIMGLLPKPAGRVTGGQIMFGGDDLLSYRPEQMRSIRGRKISMIFQEPMTALNPVQRVGRQLMETLQLHRPELSKDEQLKISVELLDRVGIPEPRQRLTEYPHQLSGGMRQRVMIAMALIHVPDILIADEPTTALDVTIQAQILELIAELQRENGMAVIFITHDLAVIAEIADRVVVMYAGRVAEEATALELFSQPLHPYTQGLLNSIPTLSGIPKTQLKTIRGMVPSFANMPSGCRFRNRCERAQQLCAQEVPEYFGAQQARSVACHFWQDSVVDVK
ncbi:MAG: ABC transporter ATP-binding protein [Gammaproteobacteria bacterium]|nr:ABC transporter ATP-binding protein [Gammaproteobacteria bacterium]MYC25610.1 ABC transporter ATP-binding protein [Gammaproteobacteria bacterium]